MIKKWIRSQCEQYFREVLAPQIADNEVARLEAHMHYERLRAEAKRHNALVEGWLKAFMTAQGIEFETPTQPKSE